MLACVICVDLIDHLVGSGGQELAPCVLVVTMPIRSSE